MSREVAHLFGARIVDRGRPSNSHELPAPESQKRPTRPRSGGGRRQVRDRGLGGPEARDGIQSGRGARYRVRRKRKAHGLPGASRAFNEFQVDGCVLGANRLCIPYCDGERRPGRTRKYTGIQHVRGGRRRRGQIARLPNRLPDARTRFFPARPSGRRR